ncbi:MAG TPA: type I-E CRISPR-associated protein Cas5/CasD [Candidatus Lokiarchaeia archaeon]|nr:type I-E CRISPR-associated protein Cas5/CasD [Candidatus Lokiarchaeia archaeon]
MQTLLLRLAGPMQSWGLQSRFTERDTAMEPSKSGVIGLLCAALGRARSASVDDLARLKMGVRVDREGVMKYDYQTALDVIKATLKGRDTVVSTRYYLSDPVFLVGLTSEIEDDPLLMSIDTALAHPRWPLYLGRKSYVPSLPVRIGKRPPTLGGPASVPGILDLEMRKALESFPILCELDPSVDKVRLIIEHDDGQVYRQDVPISFARREFAFRRVNIDWMEIDRDHVELYRDLELGNSKGGNKNVFVENHAESS